jgi:hypothetical protein
MFTALLLITLQSISSPSVQVQISVAHPEALGSPEECLEVYPEVLFDFNENFRASLTEEEYADVLFADVDAQCVSWTNS